MKDKPVNGTLGLVVSKITPFTPTLLCNIILVVPNRSRFCSSVNDLLAEMVVAVAFEQVILPAVEIAPINAGDADGAFKFKAFCVAVDIGFAKSLVFSTFARLTNPLESPPTVPENVGLMKWCLQI